VDPLYIPESAIVERIPAFEAFKYDNQAPRYPWSLPGVKLPLAPPYQNDCCTFVEALLVRAWLDIYPGEFPWSLAQHNQMMVLAEGDWFSPITALCWAGMAVELDDADQVPLPWTVVQGYRSWVGGFPPAEGSPQLGKAGGGGGHLFIVVDVEESSGRVLTLESNKFYKLNGPGFRELGNLRDNNCRPPTRWWEQEDLWTWERFLETYLYRKQAVLNVTGRYWSGLEGMSALRPGRRSGILPPARATLLDNGQAGGGLGW
jgi:hypothetical protein